MAHSNRPVSGLAIAFALLASVVANAQSDRFQFMVSAADARTGAPVSDLTPDEIVVTENGDAAPTIRVEPHAVPVKLTLAIDNGVLSSSALVHYRTGLNELLDLMPPDVEITLITTAPQPRIVVAPTTDRVRLRRGVSAFAPEDGMPRFTDTLVEYAKRLEDDLAVHSALDSLPVLLLVSTTANEASSYRPHEVERAITFLVGRRAKVFVAITSTLDPDPVTGLNSNRQALIGIPATKVTGGRYESIAASSRLTTLIPEMGAAIAALHLRHVNQVRVTVERPAGATGPIEKPTILLSRPGLTGSVSMTGFHAFQ